jgi:cell fate regulator YaaT (PSP1 superfamily)
MVGIMVIKGDTVVFVHTASTESEVRKVVNDLSTKLKITLVLLQHK